MAANGRTVDETIECTAIGSGEATDRVLGIAANDYRAVRVGANQFQFQRTFRPNWAWVVTGIALAGAAVTALLAITGQRYALFLITLVLIVVAVAPVFARRNEQWVATVDEDHRKVRVRVHGLLTAPMLLTLRDALTAGPSYAPAGPPPGLVADPVGIQAGAMPPPAGAPVDLSTLPPPGAAPADLAAMPPPSGAAQPAGALSSMPPPGGAPLDLPVPDGAPIDLAPPTTPTSPPGPTPAPSGFAPPDAAPASPPTPANPASSRPPASPSVVNNDSRPVSIAPVSGASRRPAQPASEPDIERTSLGRPSATPSTAEPAATGLVLCFDTGEEIPLEPRILIGRDPEVADGDPEARLVPIADADRSVSKTHLEITLSNGTVHVSDRGSTNGSALLDPAGEPTPLDATTPVPLEPGATVRFGERTVRLEDRKVEGLS
ncbi:MAG: FHA domain-containing protein [Microthrixaceae bacterium]